MCTFVDFKKAYDSIDRPSLIQELEEMGLDDKTVNNIKQTLTNTKSKIKFMGDFSEAFKIRTRVRQGDAISPLLFNILGDKVVRQWEKELKIKGIYKPKGVDISCLAVRQWEKELKIQGIYKPKGVDIGCLAFADDLAILTENIETALKQIEVLKERAEKV